MIDHKYITQFLQRYPTVGAIAYFVIILGLALTCCLSIAEAVNQRTALTAERENLARLQARRPTVSKPDSAGAWSGSPFLEGQTITIAGATLLERVSNAIARVGGRVLSSQVDLQTTRLKPGFVSVAINCELDQPSLQKLLYDLEAGMPFLFIEHLEVRSPETTENAQGSRIHVILTASSQWSGKL